MSEAGSVVLLAAWISACGSTRDPNAVTLRATQTGAAIRGMHVYFQNADSSVVDIADTDQDGEASAELGPGGYVTAYNGNGHFYTFIDPKRGDLLQLDFPPFTQLVVHLGVSIEPGRSASDYYVETSSPSLDPVGGSPGATPSTVSLSAELPTSFLVVTTDRATSLLATNQQVAPDATIDLTHYPFTPSAPRTYQYDTSDTPCLVEDYLLLEDGLVSTDVSVLINTTRMVAQPALTHLTRVQCAVSSLRGFVDWGPFTPDVTRDLSARLPDVPLGDGSWTYDPASRALHWSELDGSITPNFAVAVVSPTRTIQVPVPDQPGPVDVPVTWSWSVVAADQGSVTLPLLPNDDANAIDVTVQGMSVHVPDLNILDTDAVHTSITIGAGASYDSVRTSSSYMTLGPFRLFTGASGSLVFSTGGS